ncbi:MAG: hypothetical protein A3F09_05235 [Chlamydiae bacterium RIFCSPHIGHO2_12_FULL_49_11]|nr:MAG: hypothetical protein A3F09_05235 [Chlamydiae bacterium RIFCSPHIGHO2_12_FULL_49_11]
MKKGVIFAALVLSSCNLFKGNSAPSGNNPSAEPDLVSKEYTTEMETHEILTLIHARSGMIKKTGDNTYTLTMISVSRYVTYFTEPTHKHVGRKALPQLIDNWDKIFAFQDSQDKALAVMGFSNEQGEFIGIPVQLGYPKYNSEMKELQFTVFPYDPAIPVHEGTVKSITLFIDSLNRLAVITS